MIYEVLADAVVVLHSTFVLFVVLGGLLVLKWPRVAWLHVPAAIWGVLIEFAGWTCPLTPLENVIRMKAGQQAYSGGFIEHYILPVLYPEGLTRSSQVVLGAAALLINMVVYWWAFRQRSRTL
jgi:Protein of Unknown function (DUF2784)